MNYLIILSALFYLCMCQSPLGALVYLNNPAVYPVGNVINENTVTLPENFTASVFTVFPTLPTGLELNSVNGSVLGTPTLASVTTNYLIIANNTDGDVAGTVLVITVTDSKPRLDLTLGLSLGISGGLFIIVSLYLFIYKSRVNLYESQQMSRRY